MGNKMGFCSRRSDPPEEHPGPVIEKPEVPFKHMIPGGIFNGRLVRVRGYVKNQLENLMIKLQCGYYDDSNVALLLYLRSEDNFIVMNAIDKGISSDAIAAGPVPLHKGQPFEIFIICEPGYFHIIVNDMFTCDFPHLLPIDDITYIAGDGDINITLISFESVKSRPSQIIMDSLQSSTPETRVSNQNIKQNGGVQPVYQYSRESSDPTSQIHLNLSSHHVRIQQEQSNEPQRQDTPSNAGIAQRQDTPSNAGIAQRHDTPSNAGIAQRQDTPSNAGIAQRQDTPSNAGIAQRHDTPSNAGIAQRQDTPSNAGIAQRQDTPSNAGIAQQQYTPSNAQTQRPGNSPAPFVLSMPGNMPSTNNGNTNAPNSSGIPETDTNVRR